MARNIEDLFVRLKLEGFENLDKIKGSFRELNKVTGFTETEVSNLRKEVLEFGKAAGNTEAVTKGVISVLQGLRTQADLCGNAYAQLTNDLKRLNEAARGSTDTLEKQRQALLNSADAGRQNVDSIQRQINALKQLQRETRPGSSAFIQLGKDIDAVTVKLGKLKSEAQAFNLALNQQAGATPSVLNNQIAILQRGLQNVRYDAEQFVNTLRQLQLLQITQSGRTGRAGVIASFEAYQSREYLRGFADPSRLRAMPDTTAALNQELAELSDRLANTARGSSTYTDVAIRMAEVQRQLRTDVMGTSEAFRQLSIAEAGAERRAGKLADIQEYYRTQGPLASGVGGYRDPATGAMIASGSYTPGQLRRQQEAALAELGQRVRQGVSGTPLLLPAAGQTSAPGTGLNISGGANVRVGAMATAGGQRRSVTDFGGNIPVMGVRPRSGVQRFFGIADIGAAALYPGAEPLIGPRATSEQESRNRTQRLTEAAQAYDTLGRSVERSRRPLREIYKDVTSATSASNGSLSSLRRQAELWGELRAAVNPAAPAYKKAGEELDRLDGRIERLERSRRKLTGMQLAEGVGAALTGYIFGGPEGLIGGLGGLAFGGVGGAFAGAAVGAQVGMFRQQLAGVTDYSAGIDKLQIALRGIVGSQAAYSQALAAAASVTRDLNIPQETAIQGMTHLSAAVKGAGGTVSDSAFAFRALNEAVKATGGGAEQADGALLALTQVFSKGKVSAEELNQIAERLPGTFTLFAEASGKSGPELQKALQEGKVGLNDLMKFLQLISSNYGQTALKIAKSSQEAGARLSVAMKNMQLEVGRALQPIGASLQSAFADFITKITPAVVTALKGIAAAFEFLIENKTASGLAAFALQLGAVTAGLIALRSAMASLAAINIAALFTSTAASAKITGDVMTATALSAGGLTTKIAGLAAVAAKPIVITIVIASVLEALKRLGEVRSAFDDFKKATGQRSGTAWLKDMGGSALSEGQLSKLAADTSAAYNFNVSEIRKLQQQKKNIEIQLNTVDDNVIAAGLRQQLTGIDTRITTAQTRVKSTKANLDAIYKALQQRGISAAPTLTNFLTASGKEATDKVERERQAAAAEQQRLANTLLDQQLRAADRVFQHQIELDRQRYELLKRLDDMQAQNRILRETGSARDIVSNFEDLQRSLREIEERRVTAAQNVRLAQQTQQSAAVRATFAEQGAAALSSGAGISATAIAKATAEAARFTGIANQCSESVKAFYKSLGISLPGVTAWADTVRNAGTVMRDWSKLRPGDIVATGRPGDTPHVGVYTGGNNVFHQSRKRGLTAGNYPDLDYFKSGYFVRPTQSAGSAKLPTGAATQQSRAIKAGGGAVIEGLDVTQAQAQQKLIEDNAAKERAALFEQFTLKATASLREQNATMRDNNELQTLRNRLTLEGVSPERIDLEEQLLGIRQEQSKAQKAYTQLIKENPTREAELTAALTTQNEQFAERARLLRESADAAETFNKAMRNRQDERIGLGLREGARAYVDSMGTMREASSQLARTGIKGVEDALFSLVTTGTANFREFAASILKDTARMILQQMILRQVMQIFSPISSSSTAANFEMPGAAFIPQGGFKLNAMGAAYAANGIQPFAMGGAFSRGVTAYAMGGVVKRPTMFAFANGGAGRLGLMGEAGPEAIMPLRRLPSGRLGVESAGGGGMNVVVNVDASGSQVQGNSADASQLGKVLSAAVQQELINQQRPGGLLAPKR